MRYNLNGTVIELKDKLCTNWDCDYSEMEPQANLYVRVGNGCNAHCKFCTYHGQDEGFDFDKFERALKLLKSHNIIGKIQLTGGEPTLYHDRLIKIVNLVRQYFPDKFLGINSNGHDLLTLIELKDLVDNFAISRHHYDDSRNAMIFDCNTVPLSNQLKVFIDIVGSNKVHFSCTMLKSDIGNIEEVKKYLTFCSSIGCEDVGLVTLMDTNQFACDEHIPFDDIGIEEDSSFLKHKQFVKQGNCCRCANYLYMCKPTCKIVDIYGRFASNKDKTCGILSFSQDSLREGFSGQIINI